MKGLVKVLPQLLGSLLAAALMVFVLIQVGAARPGSVTNTSLEATLNQLGSGLPTLPQADVQLPAVPAPLPAPAPAAPTPTPTTSCEPNGYAMPNGVADHFVSGGNRPTAERWLQVAQSAAKAGFKGDCLAMAIAVSRAESGFRSDARNANGAPIDCDFSWRNPDCKMDRGPLQVNSYWHPEVSNDCADNLDCVMSWLYTYTRGGQESWAAWCTTGKFSVCTSDRDSVSQYVPQARLAAQQAGAWP